MAQPSEALVIMALLTVAVALRVVKPMAARTGPVVLEDIEIVRSEPFSVMTESVGWMSNGGTVHSLVPPLYVASV